MKKKSLLLAISAMSIAAIGVGTVGTFAWYQVNGSVSHNLVSETGTLTTKYTNPTAGAFTFTLDSLAVKAGSSATVDLTDQYGKSWVYLSSGTTNIQEVTPSNPTCEYEGLTWVVSYAGSSDTAAKIQAEWALLISDSSKDHASVAVTSDGENAHAVRFGNTGAAASACNAGPYTLLADIALNTISWADVEVGGTGSSRTASIVLTEQLTKKAFAVALTGTNVNEGTTAGATDSFTVATTLA